MPLEPGTQVGSYQITEPIGAGGMGEVYRATDTKLERDVAIKVLPDDVARDSERLARFEREAKILASLNHPNIAHIYGLEEADGVKALVLELVEGPTLADRIAQGPLSLEEALPIARQISEALEAAHGQGIIHRDLKPANVKMNSDGTVKVLDFGLAKAVLPEATDSNPSASPTLTAATQLGTILGTAAYMSPEQARGRPVDKRADIWAFGVVLYEMLTSHRLFRGDTVSDTLAAVLRADPDWERLPDATPRPLRRLLRRCLERAPDDRLRDAGDARLEIQDALAAGTDEPVAESAPSRRPLLPWVVAAALLLALFAVAGSIVLREPDRSPTVIFDLPPPEDSWFEFDESPATLSPDGTRIAMQLRGKPIAVRRLDRTEYDILPLDTTTWDPFWSPDGRSLGFVDWRAKKLMRADVSGGAALPLADAPRGRGATWNEDGVIVFAPDREGPLYSVRASGGDVEPVTTLDTERGEVAHLRPHFLPDGRQFLYLALDQAGVSSADGPDGTSLWIGSLDGEPSRPVAGSFESAVWYAPPGFLLYQEGGTLMARRFSLRRLAWLGDPVILAHGLDVERRVYRFSSFSVSRNGVLVYHRAPGPPPDRKLVWRDRRGVAVSELVVPGSPHDLDLAPDGRRAAVERSGESGNKNIWIVDLERGTHQRFTFDAAGEVGPVWSTDGRRVAYVREDPPTFRIFTKAASGAGDEHLVFEAEDWTRVIDWSPDGESLLFANWGGSLDLWAVPAAGSEEPLPVATTPFGEETGRFSPDGSWIAYQSNESGRWEVYVRPWPAEGGKWQVSTAGGHSPRWRGDGSEVFYIEEGRTGRLLAASVQVDEEGAFRSGTPQALFDIATDNYEPSTDGQRFLVVEAIEEADAPPVTVVLNWPALLEGDE